LAAATTASTATCFKRSSGCGARSAGVQTSSATMKVSSSSGQAQSALCNEGDGSAREDCGRAPSVSHQNVARFPLPVPVGSLRHLKGACSASMRAIFITSSGCALSCQYASGCVLMLRALATNQNPKGPSAFWRFRAGPDRPKRGYAARAIASKVRTNGSTVLRAYPFGAMFASGERPRRESGR
jgi:hypothetical protein